MPAKGPTETRATNPTRIAPGFLDPVGGSRRHLCSLQGPKLHARDPSPSRSPERLMATAEVSSLVPFHGG
jgi:hypothetical protein